MLIDYVNVKPHGKAKMWMRRNRRGIKVALLLALIVFCGSIDRLVM